MNQQRPDVRDWAGGFEDVREVERRELQQAADYLTTLRQAVALCDGILSLESSSGFMAFHKTLLDMLGHRTNELLSAREDRQAAVLQGQCRELKAILALMGSTRANREALATNVIAAEDRLRELERTFRPTKTPEKKT